MPRLKDGRAIVVGAVISVTACVLVTDAAELRLDDLRQTRERPLFFPRRAVRRPRRIQRRRLSLWRRRRQSCRRR